VGDVQGKGLKAIATTAAVLGCFREWAPETAVLKELVARLDARVVDKGGGSFVTAIVATLDELNGVEIANCGHPSPVQFGHGRPLGGVIPERRTTPLGLSPSPTLSTLHLAPNDRLLFYTDGLIECRDRAGEWIELDEALIGTVGSDPMEEALDGLLRRLQARARVLNDDIAVLLVEYVPGTDVRIS
jgi:serine phosphatase RsbU (regulator of sigma subunit)